MRAGLAAAEPHQSERCRCSSRRATIDTVEPVLSLGGPIKQNRLWFFVGYLPQISEQTRTVTFTQNGQTQSFKNPTRDHNLNWNVTGQATNDLRFRQRHQRDGARQRLAARQGAERHEPVEPGALPESTAQRHVQQPLQRRRGLGHHAEDA